MLSNKLLFIKKKMHVCQQHFLEIYKQISLIKKKRDL
jgi:hypothetical protein